MRITFDLWELAPENILDMLPEEKKVFEVFSDFVRDRIKILAEEMAKEEREDPTKKVVIEIMRQRVSFERYSAALKEKLHGSFTEQDNAILMLRFQEAFGK